MDLDLAPTSNITSPLQKQPFDYKNTIGNMFSGYQPLSLGGVQTQQSFEPKITPTNSGGVSFPATQATTFNKVQNSATNNEDKTSDASQSLSLDRYINNEYTTPGGAKVTTDSQGNVVGHNNTNNFSIDTSGGHNSNALDSNFVAGDMQRKQSQYADYVQGIAQAQGYSPEYVSALQQQQRAQLQQAGLQSQSNQINSNFYTGQDLPGDTIQYAQGATAKAQAQNTLQQSQNSIQQLSANQQMQVQALIRSGNIAAAQSLVQASQPVGVSPGTSLVSPLSGQEAYSGLGGLTGVNAVNQYNSLQQQHPDADIPAYDNSLTPAQNQQVAMKAVQSSPSFQSSTPEGQANTSSLVTQQGYADTTNRAYQTATSNLGTLQKFMAQNNINDSSIPIINQLQSKVKSGLLAPGVIAAYQSSIAGLRAEYAQVLSRGGSVTDTERKSANELIPENLSPTQLATVTKQLTLEGQNAIKEANTQVQNIKSRLNKTSGGYQSGSSWPGWSGN